MDIEEREEGGGVDRESYNLYDPNKIVEAIDNPDKPQPPPIVNREEFKERVNKHKSRSTSRVSRSISKPLKTRLQSGFKQNLYMSVRNAYGNYIKGKDSALMLVYRAKLHKELDRIIRDIPFNELPDDVQKMYNEYRQSTKVTPPPPHEEV